MNYNSYMKEKLEKTLFVEINLKGFLSLLNTSDDELKLENNNLYLPIKVERLSSEVRENLNIGDISLSWVIEGMFLTLGVDKNFKYNNDYKKILKVIPDCEEYIKAIIADYIKQKEYLDPFCLLKGLVSYDATEDYYDKLLSVGEKLIEIDKNFLDEQFSIIDDAKKDIFNSAVPYYYDALALYAAEKNSEAYVALNEYINRGGEKTPQVVSLINILKDDVDYAKGVELLDSDPKEALKYLLEVLEQNKEDAILNFYIGLAYRKIELYEKAIYYLNESIRLDSSIVEAVNEMGINYACIGNYKEAVKYLRKAFESTRDIEVCTNLIICYYNMGDLDNAKLHLEIAEKIDPDDDIVKSLKEMFSKQSKK